MEKELKEILEAIPYEEKEFFSSAGKEASGEIDYRELLGVLDLTTLDIRDTEGKVAGMCRKVNALPEKIPGSGQVAGVCVYPRFVSVVKEVLADPNVRIVAVSAGFPASQTFPEVKVRETELALEAGAQEIDIVMQVGDLLSGELDGVFGDLRLQREVTAGKAHLKVILEAGLLEPFQVHQAAVTAMAAGADFIKTSTGKVSPAARLKDVRIMARAAKRYYRLTGRKVGIKPAGGIATAIEAAQYAGVVREELGEAWLHPSLFRIGASRLANDLLRYLSGDEEVRYF